MMQNREFSRSKSSYRPDGVYLFRNVYTCAICGQVSYGARDIKRD